MLPTAIYQCVVNRLSGSRAVQRVRGAVVKSGDDEDQSSPPAVSLPKAAVTGKRLKRCRQEQVWCRCSWDISSIVSPTRADAPRKSLLLRFAGAAEKGSGKGSHMCHVGS